MASTSRAFLRPDGRPLRNLRDAVHAAVKALKKRGAVKTVMQNGARGPVCFVTLADPADPENRGERDRISDCRSVGGKVVVDQRPKLTLVQ
jgi:hypothetical protein